MTKEKQTANGRKKEIVTIYQEKKKFFSGFMDRKFLLTLFQHKIKITTEINIYHGNGQYSLQSSSHSRRGLIMINGMSQI